MVDAARKLLQWAWPDGRRRRVVGHLAPSSPAAQPETTHRSLLRLYSELVVFTLTGILQFHRNWR
jgi:hypothetical protein